MKAYDFATNVKQ